MAGSAIKTSPLVISGCFRSLKVFDDCGVSCVTGINCFVLFNVDHQGLDGFYA